MCSGSKAGSYVRLIDFAYHSTLGLRVIKKKRSTSEGVAGRLLGEVSVEGVGSRVEPWYRPQRRLRERERQTQR